jgi:hypothetical protein
MADGLPVYPIRPKVFLNNEADDVNVPLRTFSCAFAAPAVTHRAAARTRKRFRFFMVWFMVGFI